MKGVNGTWRSSCFKTIVGGPQSLLRPAGQTGGYIKHADDGCAKGAGIRLGSSWAKDVIGHKPALAVCRTAQRHRNEFMRDEVLNFNRVTSRVDVWIACLHESVHVNVAANAKAKAGRACQCGIGAHADAEHDKIGTAPGASRSLS